MPIKHSVQFESKRTAKEINSAKKLKVEVGKADCMQLRIILLIVFLSSFCLCAKAQKPIKITASDGIGSGKKQSYSVPKKSLIKTSALKQKDFEAETKRLFDSFKLLPFSGNPATEVLKDWVQYVSEEGSFKISMPTIPNKSVDEIEIEVGKFPVNHFSSTPGSLYDI